MAKQAYQSNCDRFLAVIRRFAVTQPIGSDKIPTSTTDERRTRAQGEARNQGQAAPAAGTPAKPSPEPPADVSRAAHLYAKQRSDAAATSRLANAADALALARQLRATLQAAPAAALAAHGGVQQMTVEAALAAPTT